MRGSPASIPRLALSLCIVLTLVVSPGTGSAQRSDSVTLTLRSGTVVLSQASTRVFWTALRTASLPRLVGVIALPRSPTPLERDSLRRTGIEILSPLQHGMYWAAVSSNADTVHASVRPTFYAMLGARDRVAPEIWNVSSAQYSFRQPNGAAGNYVLNADSTLNVAVVFHPGTPIPEAERLLRSHARTVTRLSDVGWKVTATLTEIRRLAESDAIRWIDAPIPPIMPENDNTRQAINVETLQNFNTTTGLVQGLGGNGITVGVFDMGIDQTHSDLASRVVVDDFGKDPHGTHVAGVIAGDGRMSVGNDSWGHANGGTPYQWRGMAPQAHLIDADANNAFVASWVSSYIKVKGMDISNHSYTYSLDGAYADIADAFHDQLIRGDATSDGNPIPARENVYSSGNSGDQPRPQGSGQQQIGYFSLSKQSKNGIMAGNFDSYHGQVDPTSSLGPAYDGRIKPDVVAPGTSVRSTGYCTLANDIFAQCGGHPQGVTSRSNFYHLATGSSDAAAAVTGMLALALQQFNATYATSPGWIPQPATLKAVTIQSAKDISGPVWYSNEDGPVQAFPGPDFVTGYGIVDAKGAVDLITSGNFVEDFVSAECEIRTWWVKANAAGELKVTLAWDDWPGNSETPYTNPRLINDLDLELVGPNSTIHYPWLLDQTAMKDGVAVSDAAQVCGSDLTVARKVFPTATPHFVAPHNASNINDPLTGGVLQAATTGKDHLNNVEQVVIQAPANGWWMVHVTGFTVPHASQRFSLVASGPLSTMLPIVIPKVFCRNSPICSPLYDRHLCERLPKVCAPVQLKPGHLQVSFSKSGQAVIVPEDRLCLFLIECPLCMRDGMCHDLNVTFSNVPANFTIAVYDTTGRRVFVDSSANTTKGIRVSTTPENRYAVLIQSGKGVKPKRRYDLTVRANGPNTESSGTPRDH